MVCRYLLSYTDAQSVVFTEAVNPEHRGTQLRPVRWEPRVWRGPGGSIVGFGPCDAGAGCSPLPSFLCLPVKLLAYKSQFSAFPNLFRASCTPYCSYMI